MARAGGIVITLDDFADLARVVPLLARVYPNGSGDVNHFHAAGGLAFVLRELGRAGLVHLDARTMAGGDLSLYAREPFLDGDRIIYRDPPERSLDTTILRGIDDPFQETGGLVVVEGNLGRSVIKTSAVALERHVIEAPARVFATQEAVVAAFKAGELDRDVVVVLRFQGPQANGMPELHSLMPTLGVLQGKGHKVALVSDGRLSGASGKVLSAIHVTPEAATGGAIARLRDGDILRIDATTGRLDALVGNEEWHARQPEPHRLDNATLDLGRNFFDSFRRLVGPADAGAATI
jgi:phosphogluconate dehydratase